MNDLNDLIEQSFEELQVAYDKHESVFSVVMYIDDNSRQKKEFTFVVDATRKNKVIVIGYIENNSKPINLENTLKNLNILNRKTTVGKFYLDVDGYFKYSASIEFNMLASFFSLNSYKKEQIKGLMQRILIFFDINYNSMNNLSKFAETIPDFKFAPNE